MKFTCVVRSFALLASFSVGVWARAEESPAPTPRVLQDHRGSVMSLSFSPDGSKLVTSSRDGTIKLWDVASGRLERTITGHADDVYCVTYSPDGALLASGSGDKTIRLWDAKTFETIRTLEGHAEVVRWVTFSPDGKTLASAGGDLTVRLWDIATGKEKKSLEGHVSVVKMVRYVPDGNTLVSTGADGTVRTWDIESGKETALLDGHTSSIEGVAISPDGTRYASSSNDNTVRVWDAKTNEPLLLLLGHVGEVDSICFTHDGRGVISGGRDKTIRLWDARSGKLLRTLSGHHTGRIESIELSNKGGTLASGGGGGDTSVRVWDFASLAPPSNASDVSPPPPPRLPADALATQRAARPTREFNPAETDRLWRLLGNDDGDDVGVSMARLVSGGDKAVAALAPRLTAPGATPAAPDKLEKLIAQLNSPDPQVRERATCDLIQAGDAAVPPIQEALKSNPAPLAQHRLEMALRDITSNPLDAKGSTRPAERAANSVNALRTIGTPAAKELLVDLSKGDPGLEITKKAKLALEEP